MLNHLLGLYRLIDLEFQQNIRPAKWVDPENYDDPVIGEIADWARSRGTEPIRCEELGGDIYEFGLRCLSAEAINFLAPWLLKFSLNEMHSDCLYYGVAVSPFLNSQWDLNKLTPTDIKIRSAFTPKQKAVIVKCLAVLENSESRSAFFYFNFGTYKDYWS